VSRILTPRGNASSSLVFDGGRARRAARRLRTILRTAIGLFPLTPLGVLVSAGAAAGLFAIARPRNDLVLLVVCAATLGIAGLSLVLGALSAAGLFLAMRRVPATGDPLRLECGVASRTGFSISSLWFVPLIKVRWSWLSPEATVEASRRAGGARLDEVVTPRRRGRSQEIVRRIEVSDTFHLVRIALRSREARAVRAFPWQGAAKSLSFAHTLAEGGDLPYPADRAQGEPSDFRRYAAGDPMRFILWKTFAKSRQLMVRAPEQAISPARRTIAYLIAGENDEAAAGVARAAIESGAFGTSWVFGADGASETAKDRAQALEVLASSGSCPPDQGGSGLEAFLRSHAKDSAARVILFTPPSPGPWVARALEAVRVWSPRMAGRLSPASRWLPGHSAGAVEAILCTDGIARRRGARLLARVLFVQDSMEGLVGAEARAAARAASQAEIAEVLRALSAGGASVHVADRRAGRVYSGRQARAILAAAEDKRRGGAGVGTESEVITGENEGEARIGEEREGTAQRAIPRGDKETRGVRETGAARRS
jgi:hypothetical protein